MRIEILLLISFVTMITFSQCKTIECEEFNLTRPIMNWHFFPNLEQAYIFTNSNADSLIFNQSFFDQSEYEERKCHMCSCYQLLNTSYENQNLGLNFTNTANYDTELFPDWIGGIQYQIDDIIADMTIEDGQLDELISQTDEETNFNITQQTNITLNSNNYSDVTQLEILVTNNSTIEKLWIQEENGLIAFEIDNTIWTKE